MNPRDRHTAITLIALITTLVSAAPVLGAALAAEPRAEEEGGSPITQQQIADGELSLDQIRIEGLRLFTMPFTRETGYGDGPMDINDTVSPGGRPTLQGNGTFLRVNGLDAQACLECHTQVSAATFPPILGIGGAGGSNANAMIMPTELDPADLADFDSAAGFNGRFANPPFVFGTGGVELVALEMTEDLQALQQYARLHPGVVVALVTKGVDFGTLVVDAVGDLDTSGVVGIDPDLVVRPFGRKGEFATIREFDIGAVQFHFGIQPVEVVGEDVDGDGDGVTNEITPGELSALNIFVATLDRPFGESLAGDAQAGFQRFVSLGCASCHVPALQTRNRELPLRFPEVPADPRANVYYTLDLSARPARFERNALGGVVVPMFADLKRHDMGPQLAETFASASPELNRQFTTAKLWGVADSSPYLHDGRATTITEAILLHGGEGQAARDAFAALDQEARGEVLAFLRTLHTPRFPMLRLLNLLRAGPSFNGASEDLVEGNQER